MFGVLVVRNEAADGQPLVSDGTAEVAPYAFLAAYSGLLSGRNDWTFFVPPVFDAQRPDGHFKLTEAEISALNHEVEALKKALNTRKRSKDWRTLKPFTPIRWQNARRILPQRRRDVTSEGQADRSQRTRKLP